MAIVKVYSTVAAKLPQLAVTDGQLIFCRDTRTIYLDMAGVRVGYTDITTLASETERTGLLAPVEGYYYVDETNLMWRYNGKWTRINSADSEVIFFGDVSSFPDTGSSNRLYVSDNAIYRWDAISRKYVVVSNKTSWTAIQ